MRQSATRFLTCVTLAGYLLATAATWFHDHHHHQSAPAEHGAYVQAVPKGCGLGAGHRCGHGSSQSSGPVEGNALESAGHSHDPRPGDVPLHDDDCFVCQYLAQKKPLSPMEASGIALGDTVDEVRPRGISRPDSTRLCIPHSRAPPCTG